MIQTRSIWRAFALSVACVPLLLTGCSDVGKALGFSKSVPDEYRVMARPPLSVPPEFHLRPPRPGAEPLHHKDADKEAQRALLGTTITSGTVTSAESTLLQKAGADKANPNIRQELRQNPDSYTDEKDGFFDKLKAGTLFGDDEEATDTLDAMDELERLKQKKNDALMDGVEEEVNSVADPTFGADDDDALFVIEKSE